MTLAVVTGSRRSGRDGTAGPLLAGNLPCGDRFDGTTSSATHSVNLRTSPHAAQSPVFRGPLRARRLETERTGTVLAVLCARSPMPIFQSPEFAVRDGRDRFVFP